MNRAKQDECDYAHVEKPVRKRRIRIDNRPITRERSQRRRQCNWCLNYARPYDYYCSDFCKEEEAREQEIEKLIQQEVTRKRKGLLKKELGE